MRALFGHVQRLFDQAGVTNAFWAVDYSTHADHDTNATVEVTWPVHRPPDYPNSVYPQARVDMVFFNCFLQPVRAKGENPFLNLVQAKYDFHSTNPLYSHLPLGIGAYGVHDWEPGYLTVPEKKVEHGKVMPFTAAEWQSYTEGSFDGLANVADNIAASIATGQHHLPLHSYEAANFAMPRLSAFVYYDARRSAIRSASSPDCDSCGAHPKSADFVSAYNRFLRSEALSWADERVFFYPFPSAPPQPPAAPPLPLVPPLPMPPSIPTPPSLWTPPLHSPSLPPKLSPALPPQALLPRAPALPPQALGLLLLLLLALCSAVAVRHRCVHRWSMCFLWLRFRKLSPGAASVASMVRPEKVRPEEEEADEKYEECIKQDMHEKEGDTGEDQVNAQGAADSDPLRVGVCERKEEAEAAQTQAEEVYVEI